jgi:hypothetical protein
MNPDGVSYLDVADKYLQRDWSWAVNAYWSPLYSWLLAVMLHVFRPDAFWEYPAVHLLNLLLYLVAFACFEVLLFQVIRHQAEPVEHSRDGLRLAPWAWQCLGYVLFLWCALVLITVSAATPDMCVAAIVFLLAAVLLRIRSQPARWSGFVLLGILLGTAYLAKTVMFPLSFVFLAVGLFSAGGWRRALPRVIVSFLLFMLVSAPFLLALHGAKGRWTFGDSGRLTYAWLVNDATPYLHWRGDPPGSGTPAHPTRMVFASPPVYEFGEPIRSTYPPWYDPSYWNEGLVGRLDLEDQSKALLRAARDYFSIFVKDPIGMAVLVGFLSLRLFKRPRTLDANVPLWSVFAAACAALLLYALVHVESRLVGCFAVLFWLGLLSTVRLRDEGPGDGFPSVVAAVVIASMTVLVVGSMTSVSLALRTVATGGEESAAEHWQVADSLSRMGVEPGDPVGSIGHGFGSAIYWARLARVRIVAEITGSHVAHPLDVEMFWNSTDEVKNRIVEAFRATGAKVIVADRIPPRLSRPGWQRVGKTGHYAYFLDADGHDELSYR